MLCVQIHGGTILFWNRDFVLGVTAYAKRRSRHPSMHAVCKVPNEKYDDQFLSHTGNHLTISIGSVQLVVYRRYR